MQAAGGAGGEEGASDKQSFEEHLGCAWSRDVGGCEAGREGACHATHTTTGGGELQRAYHVCDV